MVLSGIFSFSNIGETPFPLIERGLLKKERPRFVKQAALYRYAGWSGPLPWVEKMTHMQAAHEKATNLPFRKILRNGRKGKVRTEYHQFRLSVMWSPNH